MLLEAFASSRARSSGSSACRGCRLEPLRELAARAPGGSASCRASSPTRDPGAASPRRRGRAALSRDRAVRRPLHGARLRQADGAQRRRRLRRGRPRTARPGSSRRAIPRRWPRRPGRAARATRPRASRLAAAARAAAAGAYSLGRDRGAARSTLYRDAASADNRRDDRDPRSSSGLASGCSSTRTSATRWCSRRSRACAAARPPAPLPTTATCRASR